MNLTKKFLTLVIICGIGFFTNCNKDLNEEINCEKQYMLI